MVRTHLGSPFRQGLLESNRGNTRGYITQRLILKPNPSIGSSDTLKEQINLVQDKKPNRLIKLSVLYLVSALSGIPLSIYFSKVFLGITDMFALFPELDNIIIFTILLTLFLIPLGITSVLLENRKEIIILSVLIPISFIVGTLKGASYIFNYQIAIIFFLNLLGTFTFLNSVKKDKLSYVKFKAKRLLLPNMRILISIFAISLTVIIYTNLSEVIKDKGFKIPPKFIEKITKGSLSNTFGNKLIEEMSKSTGQYFSQEELFNTFREEIPETLQEGQLRQDLIPQNIQDILTNQLKADDTSPESLLSNLSNKIVSDIEDFLKPYVTLIVILVSLGIFWFIQFTGFLVSFIVIPLISFLFYLLEKINFIAMVEKDVKIRIPSLD